MSVVAASSVRRRSGTFIEESCWVMTNVTACAAPSLVPRYGQSQLLSREKEIDLARQFRLTRDPALSRRLV